jgi:hypothetical protein
VPIHSKTGLSVALSFATRTICLQDEMKPLTAIERLMIMTIAKFVQIRVLTITKNPYVPNSFDQSIHVCVLVDCEQTSFSWVTIRPLYYQSHVSQFNNLNDFITDAALIWKDRQGRERSGWSPAHLWLERRQCGARLSLDKIAQLAPGTAAVAPFLLQVPPTIPTLKQDLIVYSQGLVPGCQLLNGPNC